MIKDQPSLTYDLIVAVLATGYVGWALTTGYIHIGTFRNSRTEDPKRYWIGIALYGLFAAAMWYQAVKAFWLI
jgi:hypothetical protein